jgi:CRP-like cAMP-binding protein
MFVDELRRAVEAAPRLELPKVAQLLWRAYAAGQVTEAEASEISERIETRRAMPAQERAPRRRVGSRPRTPESMERRRRWAYSNRLPRQLKASFTVGELAVLAVVAAEVERRGVCTLPNDQIAAIAGVCRSTVKNALREARARGLVSIEERRKTPRYNAPNVVRIIAPEWRSWLRLGGRDNAGRDHASRGNVSRSRWVGKSVASTTTESKSGLALTRENMPSGPPTAAQSAILNQRRP